MKLRVLVLQRVVVVLDSNRSHLLFGCAVFVHVPFCHERVKAREGKALEKFRLHVSRAAKCGRRLGCGNIGHLLHSSDNNNVIGAASNRKVAFAHRTSAACILHPCRGHIFQSKLVRKQRRYVLLTYKPARAHRAAVYRIYFFARYFCIFERCEARLGHKAFEIALPAFAKLRHPYSYYSHVSHKNHPRFPPVFISVFISILQ